MKKVGLTVYGFNIQDNMNQRLELHNVVTGKGVIDIVNEFMNKYNTSYVNDNKAEKLFKSDSLPVKEKIKNENGNDKFSVIYGVIKTGEYGIESEIVDSKTGKIVFKKGVGDADVLPFYFCIAVPSGSITRGIIIFQTLGLYGMKSIFCSRLEEYIKELDNNLKINIGNIVPKTYIERYLERGILQKIRMIKYDIPQDLSERIGINNGVDITYQELVIHKPIGFIQNKKEMIKECLRGQRVCNSIIEIENFKYDDLKLEVKMGNTTKTLKLSNIDKLVVTEDITDEIVLLGGNPTANSITPILINTAEAYLKEMGLLE